MHKDLTEIIDPRKAVCKWYYLYALRQPPVKIPMTPKGVEHEAICVARALDGLVKIPMTPKGVEHRCCPSAPHTCNPVKIPMTPKGVEHC